MTKRTATLVGASVLALFSCSAKEARACSPATHVVIPEDPISPGEAAAGLLAIGVASASASVTLGTLLDETGRFPTATAAVTSLPAPVSGMVIGMGVYPISDCPPGDISVKAFSLRALVPLSLGILPSVVGWWASGSSTSPPVGVTAQLGNRTQALSLFARF